MSSEYDRVEITNDESQGRFSGLIDTLKHGLSQSVETVTRQSRFEISGSGVDQIDAPEDLDELVDLAKSVGFVWQAFKIFANEVWEPGYRLEGPDETVAFFMGESEDIDASPPADTPEGGYLKNAGVFAGETHQDFFDIGKEATFQRRLRGTVIIELLKADKDNPESEITGFNFVRPETISAEVYPNKNILIRPDDTDQAGVETTRRGEAAAYIQFDDNSILGRRGELRDKTEIPLSQNDVHKQVLNPGIGDDASEEQGVFGTSEIEPIKEDITEYIQIKRDEATAIGNKAHGIWLIEHGREVLDLGNGQFEIVEWDDESMDDFESRLDDIGPGEFITHDGSVTPDRVDGDVPDLESVKDNYIDDIFSGLPVPKHKVGFVDDINRDVTEQRNEDNQLQVKQEREYQERQWTKVFREIANRKGLPTGGLQLKIEPEPEDSPVMSLTTEEIDKLSTYADALNSLAGPQGGPQTLVDTETLLTDVAQLPESVNEVDEIDPEETADPETMSTFMDIMEMDTLQAFSEGTWVDTPDGKGLVEDTVTEGTVDGIGATSDDPVVVVAMVESEGVNFYKQSEISEGSEPGAGPETPEEDLEALANIAQADDTVDTLQFGEFDYPESWKESETPNRVILLKAYAGMGASFTGCRSEGLRADLCASIKDAVLGTHDWRGGWAD